MGRARIALILAVFLGACGSSEIPEQASITYSTPYRDLPEPPTTTTTTTTAPPPPPTTQKPRVTVARPARQQNTPRPVAEPQAAPEPVSGDVRKVSSTAYCLTSRTANGGRGYVGSVAMNGVPFGSKWRVVGTGAEYVVNDRIGHSSQFDVWMPSCDAAIQYGRRSITIERIA